MTPSIITYTGRRVNPLDLQVSDVRIEDIAHHLACINRFNGALVFPVNVAQHSVYVSQLCDGTGRELEALLHDGGEAYCGDMTKWLKESPEMASFRIAEGRAQLAVYQAFGIKDVFHEDGMSPVVKAADKLMVRYEGYRSGIVIDRDGYGPPTDEEIVRVGPWRPWDWVTAEKRFLERFISLYKGVGA